MTYSYILGGEVTDDILKLNQESLTWTMVGRMNKKRGWHKGSVIDLTEELMSHCITEGLAIQLEAFHQMNSPELSFVLDMFKCCLFLQLKSLFWFF